MKKLIILLTGFFLLSTGAAWGTPWPITYELTGLLSGDYNGVSFTGSIFNLQLTANAMDVTPVTTFDPSSPNDLYVVGVHPYHAGPSLNGSLSLKDLGVFTFLNNLYVSDSQQNNLQPGILEIGTDVEAAFIDISDPFFTTYKMMTKVNPLTISGSQAGYSSFAVAEAGGAVGELTLADATSLTFQAEGGVPEPSTFMLLGAGLFGLIFTRRKRS